MIFIRCACGSTLLISELTQDNNTNVIIVERHKCNDLLKEGEKYGRT